MSDSWGKQVTVVLHYIPESQEFEGGFEAVTLIGVPHGVSIAGSDPHSAEGALNSIISGLRTFRFSGGVNVEDTTYIGSVQRYEVRVEP